MSDFWEKNKGTFASGLKKTGKIGLSGTKYVAKTGYQASKNLNNKKSRNDGSYSEEDHMRDSGVHSHHHNGYSSSVRDPSSFPPPPMRGTSPSQTAKAGMHSTEHSYSPQYPVHQTPQVYGQQPAYHQSLSPVHQHPQQPPSLPQRNYHQPPPPPRSEYQQSPSLSYQQSPNYKPLSPPRPNGQYPAPIQTQTTQGSYPQVNPYSLTEPHVKPRLDMAPVDLSNLPPPPTHRDRNSTISSQSQRVPDRSKSFSPTPSDFDSLQKDPQRSTPSSMAVPSPHPALPPRQGSIPSSTQSSTSSQTPPKSGMVDVSLFPPPPKPKPTPSAERELSLNNQGPNISEPTPRGRLAGSKPPPPPVKPKPRNLAGGGTTASSSSASSMPAASADSIAQELSQVQLRKTNSKHSQDTQTTSSKQPPPVPSKTASLKLSTDQQEANPFERYLKSAVPAENDRLHKPM